MKKIFALVLALALFGAALPAGAEMLSGGWEMVDQEEGTLPEDAKSAFDKSQKKLVGASYKPLALLAT